ncbi:hypothetical protein GCM10010394_37670 [Streptomyces crystallinus]|uniref:Uncharacterized protein n=1 Tax=Streptomyces crystallinus TaxID=68191 RepID=A0ABN1G610_9ACTN
MATAPTATAADAPSSPVRTGAADLFLAGAAERRWRPICGPPSLLQCCGPWAPGPVRGDGGWSERVRLIASGLYAMTQEGEVLRELLAG